MLTGGYHRNRFFGRLHNELTGLWNFLFPQACCLCGEAKATALHGFCSSCCSELPSLTQPHCPRCALPFISDEGGNHLCGDCLLDPPSFRWTVAAGLFQGNLRQAIHQFKFAGRFQLAGPLAGLILDAARNSIEDFSPHLLIPVPLHFERLRDRTFNQSLLLARALGQQLEIAAPSRILTRVRPTSPQQSLPAKERHKNLAGAFDVQGDVSGRRIILIDDVMTTGSTARECARTLMRHGAEQIAVVVAARALKKT